MENKNSKNVLLIGAGVLSTTFASLIKNIEPDWNIKIFERLDAPAIESSNERNNAGTGHAALCELNYTVEQPDGSIDIEKAKAINEQFEVSKQFWGHLVQSGQIQNPDEFIKPLPHLSFVQGDKNVDFLKKRFEAMSHFKMFEGMEYSEDPDTIRDWIPLMMEGRGTDESFAASKIDGGTDVSFGELTRKLAQNINEHKSAEIHYNHEVIAFRRLEDSKWQVEVHDLETGAREFHVTDYIIVGAGGNAIPMLQKTKIPESRNLGGFPITGAFLVCNNPEVVSRHDVKVYGKEPEGTPPMTVPHLDRRYLKGKDSLLFGPFAAIGPKFLKYGSNMDLFNSVNRNNILTLASSGIKNLSLIKYSIQQVMMDKEDRMKELRKFVPDAKDADWDLEFAGKRVQVIKDSEEHGRGFIQFGTEIVHSEDDSVIALLGESPGASVSVSVALEVLENNFSQYIDQWQSKIQEMIPSYGQSLIEDSELLDKVRKSSNQQLEL